MTRAIYVMRHWPRRLPTTKRKLTHRCHSGLPLYRFAVGLREASGQALRAAWYYPNGRGCGGLAV